MPPVGFKPTISAGERPQTYALDSAVTGTGLIIWLVQDKLGGGGVEKAVGVYLGIAVESVRKPTKHVGIWNGYLKNM
jgi:hypothetical protein